jgi:ribonuclease BN (tRNA processing enzyme)
MFDIRKCSLIIATLAMATLAVSCAAPVSECPPAAGVALQVLGSGGPIADDGRASSGYIVWVDGKSRVLVDSGGGTFLRFGEARASFTELDFVGLSHLHTDHSADFLPLLKSGNFSGRKRPLRVAGPDRAKLFPGIDSYFSALLDSDNGAYRYLSGYLEGTGGLARLEVEEVAKGSRTPETVFGSDTTNIEIDAMHVPHGVVPALGFRVRVGDESIVFSSDQNGSDPQFIDFAKDATVLVMHMPIPEGATGGALQLHAAPSRVGEIAAEAHAGTLVLSHFMARSLNDLDANVAVVREHYGGKIVVADDLKCLVVQR